MCAAGKKKQRRGKEDQATATTTRRTFTAPQLFYRCSRVSSSKKNLRWVHCNTATITRTPTQEPSLARTCTRHFPTPLFLSLAHIFSLRIEPNKVWIFVKMALKKESLYRTLKEFCTQFFRPSLNRVLHFALRTFQMLARDLEQVQVQSHFVWVWVIPSASRPPFSGGRLSVNLV